MLVVETYLAPSRLHGFGVFTRHAIPKGAVVSRYMPPFDVIFPAGLLASLSDAEQRYLKHHTYRSLFSQAYVLPGDHDRFMNHSDTPNVGMHPAGTTENIALVDVAAGEELTCDYRTFDLEWQEKLPHLCES
ncbi:MAG: SET domain-containing protein [Deltaproteobacteria bacterium]|nr:SET domain-containing protein [Deltaproteobacteria bacterium]